jgi:hypothetical protein
LDSGDQYGGKMTSKATVTVAAIDEAMRAEWCHHHVIFAGTARSTAHRGKNKRQLWHNQGGLARRGCPLLTPHGINVNAH